jgi:hypothetical protein
MTVVLFCHLKNNYYFYKKELIMKRILLLSVSAICLVFSGCKKDNILSNKMSATIGTTTWTAISPAAKSNTTSYTITGTSVDLKILEITVFGTTKGTYKQETLTLKCQATYKSGSDYYNSVLGTVNITGLNTSTNKMSGNFTFSMVKNLNLSETLIISNGIFSEVPIVL